VASALWVGYVPDDDRIAAVAQTVSTQVEPESESHASANFRRHLSAVLTCRALQQAINWQSPGLTTSGFLFIIDYTVNYCPMKDTMWDVPVMRKIA
jgi:hypothetical protein